MRFPPVSDRVKEAPAQALRGIFAGIGQVLLLTDRLRNKAAPAQRQPQPLAPRRSQTAPDAARPAQGTAPPDPATADPASEVAPAAPDTPQQARDTAPPVPDTAAEDEERPAEDTAAPAEDTAAPAEERARPEAGTPLATRIPEARDPDRTGNVRLLTGEAPGPAAPPRAAGAGAGAEGEAAAAAADLPLANYDQLSVASLRARLRTLDAAQLRQLSGYERAHAGREDVLAMFERRIAKLETGT